MKTKVTVYSKKTIAIIPPDGEFAEQDFAINRISRYLQELGINITLLCTKNNQINSLYIDNIKIFESKIEIIDYLKNHTFNLILSRSWMHRYEFAALLTQEFNNVVSYIKDWHDYPLEYYKFIFNTDEDIQAMESIFKNSQIILSHYTKEYTDKLSKKYKTNKKKNLFFPEYTNEGNFYKKKKIEYDIKTIKILAAGGVPSTSFPDIIIPGKAYFDNIQKVLQNNIHIDIIIVEKYYNKIFNNKNLYQDYLFENEFNTLFCIKKGENLNSQIGEEYQFGMFFLGTELSDNSYYIQAESFAVTSKLAFYMEAGLPILVNKRFKSISKIVEENGIGLILDDKDLENLYIFLDIGTKKYNKLIKNVYKFREKFSYNNKTMKQILELL